MISTRAFVISFVFVLVLQGSLEAGRLFAPRDTIASDLKTEDRTINNRLVICESQCRSEKQETPQLKKVCNDNIARNVLFGGSTMPAVLRIALLFLSGQNIEEMLLCQGLELLKTTQYEGGN